MPAFPRPKPTLVYLRCLRDLSFPSGLFGSSFQLRTSRKRVYFEFSSFKITIPVQTQFTRYIVKEFTQVWSLRYSFLTQLGRNSWYSSSEGFIPINVLLEKFHCWLTLWNAVAPLLLLRSFNLDVITPNYRAFPCPDTFQKNELPFRGGYLGWARHRGQPGGMLCIAKGSRRSRNSDVHSQGRQRAGLGSAVRNSNCSVRVSHNYCN